MRIDKKDINLYDTLFSGQCFRMFMEEDKSYTIILSDRVINIKEDDKYLIIDSNLNDNLEEVVINYFDLNRDYNSLNDRLSKNKIIKDNLDKVKGYKILKQDKFEMFITYIISQNNRVSKIMSSVQKLSIKYGQKVIFKEKEYYLFPKYESIKDISVSELRSLGVGFRDQYIRNALDYLNDNPSFLSDLVNVDTNEALKLLTSIKGIGTKVASCILLFAYARFDCYPVDTWVRKFVSNNFNVKDNIKDISIYMNKEFGDLSALAIQYFYHIERNKTPSV